jgi:hypothetical protein
MKIFQLRPIALTNGELAATWFGRRGGPWEDGRLCTPERLLNRWRPLRLHLMDLERGPTTTLFSRNAVAVDIKTSLQLRDFGEIELLPIELETCGTYYLLHITASSQLPDEAQLRIGGTFGHASRKVVSLPGTFALQHRFFRFQHGQRQRGTPDYLDGVYMNCEGARAIEEACSGYLYGREVPVF